MDPFATLSTAAAIAQFVEMSITLITKTSDVYKSVSGLPAEDEQLGFIMSELSRLSDAMVPTKPSFEQSDAEKALARIATKCYTLAEQLLDVLARVKAKEPHSLRRSAAAALRSWWNEKEKKQLKAQAEECRELLQMQLTVVMGSDTIKALKQLAETGLANEAELASLQKHVGALRKGVTLNQLGAEAETKLAGLLKLSDDALDSIANHRILNCLTFPEMHRRYGQVGKSFSETFKWIFEENPRKDKRALTGRFLFREWLESGNGVFHLAGKPGAGKSTLMKFLYKHEQTKQLLESWAKGRRLVVGKFFFWRPGLEMENSITAMIRTLLHEVFEQCPELLQRIFPQQWSLARKLPWQATIQLNFDGDEIRDAFNRLLEHRNQDEERCFCLFIDGLDEFRENRDEGYKALNRLILDWTKNAHGDIKVCVSSRENTVFLDSFSGFQGLRLQDLTYDDILLFARLRLESNQNFLDLEKPEGEGDSLISQVARRANGVFLWVALVVQMLDDACDHGDTFAELQRKLEFTPPEIEDVFQQLFDSIHMSDRDQSAQTFAIILRLLENKSDHRLSLMRYSLLDEYNHDPEFASKPDFEDKSFLRHDFTPRLEKARRQLYKRCKGLLEITQTGQPYRGGQVRLTHRSVHEFLLRSQMEDERSARLQHFDVFGAICQTLVAELCLSYSRVSPTRPPFSEELVDNVAFLASLGSDSEKFMPAMWNLQKRYNQHIKPWLDPHELKPPESWMESAATVNPWSVSHCAAQFGLDQYFTSNSRPSFAVDSADYRSLILAILFGIRRSDEEGNNGRNQILRWIFQQGFSPNEIALSDEDVSLWAKFLNVYLNSDALLCKPCTAEAIQLFLEYGADREVSLSYANEKYIRVECPPPIGMTQLRSSLSFKPSQAGKVPKHIFDEGPVTFRSYISSSEAFNKEALLALLDPDEQKTPSGIAAVLNVTAEQVIVKIRSALGNQLFTFALGGILGVILMYFFSYYATQ